MQEPEGTGLRQFPFEGQIADFQENILTTNGAAVEINAHCHGEAITWFQRGCRQAAFNSDRALDPQDRAFGGLLNHTGTIDQEDKRFRTAIHDRHFRSIQFNHNIINTTASKGRHQMFNRCDRPMMIIGNCGAQPRIDNGVIPGANVPRTVLKINAPEQNASIGIRRDKRHVDGRTGMKADAIAMDRRFQRPL